MSFCSTKKLNIIKITFQLQINVEGHEMYSLPIWMTKITNLKK